MKSVGRVGVQPDRRMRSAPADPLPRTQLRDGGRPREDPRPLFDPKRGWFRRLERRVSNALSSRVFPRVRGLSRLYDRQLRSGLTVSEVEVELDSLPPAFDGLRMLFISDIHAGPFVSTKALAHSFRRLLQRHRYTGAE